MRMVSCEDRHAPFVEVFRRTAERAGYVVDIVNPGTAMAAGFERLLKAYRHLSPNPMEFELASFRRWFEIRDMVTANERFVLADSDLVIFSRWNELPEELRSFDGLVGSIGCTNNVLEKGINGGFSIWTGELLRRFCDYIVRIYETDFARLAAIHQELVAAGNSRASISDMTLLYQWVQDEAVPFMNSNRIFEAAGERHYIDHNFFMRTAVDVKFASQLGRKVLILRNGRAYTTTACGETVTIDSLHLAGRYKIMATDIEAHNQLGITKKSAYILAGRTARQLLSRVGISV